MTGPVTGVVARAWRAAAALLVAATGAAVTARPALAAPGDGHAVPTGTPLASPTPATPGVQLLAQTPWVEGHATFQLRLGVNDPDPATDTVRLLVFPRLVTRSDFQAAAAGRINSYAIYSAAPAVARLPADPAGGVDVNVPVDTPAPARSPFPTLQTYVQGGVYPVQVSVTTADGHPIGSPFTTFMVYAQGDQATTGYPALSVAVVVPYRSPADIGPAGRLRAPDPAEAARLNDLAGALNADSVVPASVLASPLTVASIAAGSAAGSATDRNTVAQLTGTPQNGLIQILPSTYSPVSPGDLSVAGLGDEADRQIAAGSTTLAGGFGVTPSESTWVVDGPVNDATVSVLLAHHARQLIVPDGDLSPLTSVITFGYPTTLSFGSAGPTVMAADPGITADFTRDEPPVLAANQLLAELAMIQTETPGYARGVVAMPPADWTVSPVFMSTVLAGLDGNPLLQGVTASGLFSKVRTADATRTLATPGAAGSSPAGQALGRAATDILRARASVNALAALLPGPSPQVTDMQQRLLAAESDTLSSAQREAVLTAVVAEAGKVTDMVSLPPATSMTLTSTRGQLPITILTSAGLHPRVELHLVSQRLQFHPFNTPEGPCQAPVISRLVCTLDLTSRNTTLKVPVESRSSGVFQLEVFLYPPGASSGPFLAHDSDTVRSTAVSSVGIIIIVVAVLSLALWWGRDLRHGRRPGKLAPAPVEPGAADLDLTGGHLGAPGPTGIEEFFASPPPDWPARRDPSPDDRAAPGSRPARSPAAGAKEADGGRMSPMRRARGPKRLSG